MEEIWKDIEGYEGLYKVSTLSRVRSKFGKILNGSVWDGYRIFNLSKSGKARKWRIHILVAIHFIPNPENYPIVRHLNDIKDDNRLENLAWGTCKDNAEDARINGKLCIGDKNGMSGKIGKMGASNHKSKIVLNTETGIFYECVPEAANGLGIKPNKLYSMLRGVTKNKTNLIYA